MASFIIGDYFAIRGHYSLVWVITREMFGQLGLEQIKSNCQDILEALEA